MPIHEYHCEPCGHAFEVLIRREDDQARCPQCDGAKVERLWSTPAAARTSSGAGLSVMSQGPGPGGCARPGCGPAGCAGMG